MNAFAASWEAGARCRRLAWLLHACVVEEKHAQLVLAFKAGFNPNQPRVPAGNPDGGQWTGSGGRSGSSGANGGGLTQVAQNVPPDHLTDIPEERPESARLRNAVIKRVATFVARLAAEHFLGEPAGLILNAIDIASSAAWVVEEGGALIEAYADPPKSLEELQDAVATPARGYNIHHIVEQGPAEQDDFPRSMIDAPDNLVRIPTLKHWQITGWYGTKSKEFGGMSPRQYLRGKGWTERTQMGLRALVDNGVLKP
jgi:hypothetical protein